jgi:hypothetical protein
LALAALWYALVPIAGAFVVRRSWRRFRRRFDDLRLAPILDYRASRELSGEGEDFRFFGGFESVTDGKTLWVRSDSLTVPIELSAAQIYLLPAAEGAPDQRSYDLDVGQPERIRWERVAALSEGAKVFIGGRARPEAGRVRFQSADDEPLLVILYDGDERSMLERTVRAGRHRNEYWNPATPYALALGVFCELIVGLSFSPRPAFRPAAAAAFTAAFGPLLTILPPGLLLTSLYRRFWRRARAFRAFRDLVLLPTRHLPNGRTEAILGNGERYGSVILKDGARRIAEAKLPVLPPGTEADEIGPWFCFGSLGGAEKDEEIEGNNPGEQALTKEPRLPEEPKDPAALFAAMPGDPIVLSQGFKIRARFLEIAASTALMAAVGINAALAYALIRLFR